MNALGTLMQIALLVHLITKIVRVFADSVTQVVLHAVAPQVINIHHASLDYYTLLLMEHAHFLALEPLAKTDSTAMAATTAMLIATDLIFIVV